MRITDISIRQLPFTENGQQKIRDDLLPGFGLIVGKRSKTFFVMYGKDRRTKTLGQWPEISLKEARQDAKRLLAHPVPKKRTMSFTEARTAFLDDCSLRLKPSTVARYHFALKDITARSLDTVSLDVTDATQLKSLKVFYNWCIDRGLTDKNPFTRRKVIFAQRDRVLSNEEVAKIWQHEHTPYSDILKMLLLTGQRRAQFANFNQEWIKDDHIIFPPAVMKSGREHIIPFLNEWKPYLPQTSSNSWSKNKDRLDSEIGFSDYVLHDFRRYFSTSCARLGVPLHITELILDHRSELSGVAAIYNRWNFLPEMRQALHTYHDHLSSQVLRQLFF